MYGCMGTRQCLIYLYLYWMCACAVYSVLGNHILVPVTIFKNKKKMDDFFSSGKSAESAWFLHDFSQVKDSQNRNKQKWVGDVTGTKQRQF